jgi:hypothetical protein
MTSEFLWPDGSSRYWLDALALPAVPWAAPFLPLLGLPAKLVAQPAMLNPIHTQAAAARRRLLEATMPAGEVAGLDGAIAREVMTAALQQLADRLGPEVAVAFAQWACRNFVHGEITNALLAWRLILRHACGLGTPMYEQVPPPAPLRPLLPTIADLVSDERERELDVDLRRHAPPPSSEERELGLDLPATALKIKEIAENDLTLRALQILGARLRDTERAAVAAWATAQATAQQIPAPLLDGETYLRSPDPCAGVSFADLSPSVKRSGQNGH